jgi:hypothetical protein
VKQATGLDIGDCFIEAGRAPRTPCVEEKVIGDSVTLLAQALVLAREKHHELFVRMFQSRLPDAPSLWFCQQSSDRVDAFLNAHVVEHQ